MSGTSLDGVDGILASIPDHYPEERLAIHAAAHVAFPPDLRADLMGLQALGHNEIEREALAANRLAALYAECVGQLLAQTGVVRQQVRAIGAHGQTIRHRPELGFTRQTNNPALLAELTGIDVIADFRSRDIAAGGQGAPLVPAFHHAAFGKPGETRVLVNIGGMANISILHDDGRISGFDTGPGNVLMDAWIALHRGQDYDEDGRWAGSGMDCRELLERMLDEPFFALAPPKSTGRDLFHLDWLHEKINGVSDSAPLKPEDVQATLAQLTAHTIAEAIARHAHDARRVFVCGGGAHNRHLLMQLRQALQSMRVQAVVETTDALGVLPGQVEALAFAWLAQRFCARRPGSLTAVTGARAPRILGALYPA